MGVFWGVPPFKETPYITLILIWLWVIPSWEPTYSLPRHLRRWFSLSPGGICDRSLGSMLLYAFIIVPMGGVKLLLISCHPYPFVARPLAWEVHMTYVSKAYVWAGAASRAVCFFGRWDRNWEVKQSKTYKTIQWYIELSWFLPKNAVKMVSPKIWDPARITI